MPRAALTKDRILEVAVAYADQHGVQALTMRKLAQELGTGAMSLYNHVANKEEMLTGMVDRVVAEIVPPDVEGDWKEALRANAKAAHQVLLKHPWAADEWSRRMPGPERIRYMDSILRVLSKGPLGPELVYHGYHAVTMHIVGFTLQQIGYMQDLDENFEAIAHEFLEGMAEEYPYMAEHVRAHLEDDGHGDEFTIVLDLILNGLELAGKAQ